MCSIDHSEHRRCLLGLNPVPARDRVYLVVALDERMSWRNQFLMGLCHFIGDHEAVSLTSFALYRLIEDLMLFCRETRQSAGASGGEQHLGWHK